MDPRSVIATFTLLYASSFNLGLSGVFGLLGGDEAISAMTTIHIYPGRRWLGWYNSPGSYQIAKQYGLAAKSKFFRWLFPGVRTDLAKLFGFEGGQGPRYRGTCSGTIMDSTGHLASVLVKQCAAQEIEKEVPRRPGAQEIRVTVVTLGSVPAKEIRLQSVRYYPTFFAIVPIASSLIACITSAIYKDWVSSGLIFWGMFAHGISCAVIGSGTLGFTHPIPAAGCPPGDGILDAPKQFILLKGAEGAVNPITRGELHLDFPRKFGDAYIGYCSTLLLIQFVVQLLLIPQASLSGQITFLFSLAVSWAYDSWLSLDKEEIQQHMIWEQVLQTSILKTHTCSGRTSAVVFALLVLSPQEPKRFLETHLPNETQVWEQWREVLGARFRKGEELRFSATDWGQKGYSKSESKLLETLYRDAQKAYEDFQEFSKDSTDLPPNGK